ncbi:MULTISPECIES: hypothetical protein [Butyricimonas]|uniref:hypothetical protein n=1 Tax=Butyricimonas TaxID=574697 RepID=UPI0022E49E47|nr:MULTISPECIES: hypothetical protein [Butyricimonas]
MNNVYKSLKSWPYHLTRVCKNGSTTIYADDFNGFRVFVHVQRDGYITIQADNDTIINEYIETIPHPVIHKLEDGDKVCRWYFGDDHVIFRLEESGSISVSSNKIELVNLYCEPGNLKRVKDFLNRY